MTATYFDSYKVSVPGGRSGPWRVDRFVVPREPTIQNIRLVAHGMKPVPPGQYTRLLRDGEREPMMSDTPYEVESHLPFIRRAEGRVLINGLGLGMVLGAVLTKPQVTHVDVVEIDQDIANLVWPTYAPDLRANLFVADAYTITWPLGTKWDYAWHDIWPDICGDNWDGMKRLHRKYAKAGCWQDSWQRENVRRLARSDR